MMFKRIHAVSRIFIVTGTMLGLSPIVHSADLTSTDRIQQDPRRAYSVIKALLIEEEGCCEWDGDTGIERGPGVLHLTSCDPLSAQIVVRGPLRSGFVDTAGEVLSAKSLLEKLRVPAYFWQSRLSKYEDDMLNNLIRGEDRKFDLATALAADLNRLLRRRDVRLEVPECGGGIVEYEVLTWPAGGQVYVMPKLLYLFCQRTGDDPNDPQKCDHWFPPIRHGEKVFLGGIYKYWISWKTDKTPIKEFDADRYIETQSITIE